VYARFKSKDELFNAYVERRCLWQDEITRVTRCDPFSLLI